MTGFWKKLDTVIRAQINDLIDVNKDDDTSRARRKYLARHDVNRSLQGDVKQLQQRIQDALAYEEELQAKIDALYASIAEWDAKADEAVGAGRDDDARLALGRLQQAQRELEMEESALSEHRYLTRELMSQVGALESALFEANQSEGEAVEAPDVPEQRTTSSVLDGLSKQLDQTRETLSQLVEESFKSVTGIGETPDDAQNKAPNRQQPVEEKQKRPAYPVNQRVVDDDLARRRSRLAKPPTSGDSENSE